jgi:glycosyltransferase involved in cell wall biosynthesis
MTISVCIPTYNQAAYIEQAVRSVMSQSLLPDEVIVSDDCSTDHTADVLRRLAAEFSILTVIRQPVNKGISSNTDSCLRAAKGDYIVRLDSDDMIYPDYIRTLTTQLNSNPDAGYAHAAVQEIDCNNNPMKQRKLFRSTGFQNSDEALQSALKGYRVAANILIFKKEALEKAGYIHASQDFAEDYYLAVSIAKAGYGNVYCDVILSAYRVWADVGKVRQRRKLAEINGLNAVFSEPLTEAFEQRGWNMGRILRTKENFAVRHSGCLSWKVYNDQEKRELEKAILNLSSSVRTKFFIWIYKNGFGKSIDLYQDFEVMVKQQIKKMISLKPQSA